MPPAILLMGPTASGKTALAMALADRFPVELVSVDSAQVFRDMDIGTAKPDRTTLEKYPHHLIDLISPEDRYSAARFRDDALRVMGEIAARGKVPLLVGGTMLYFKALRDGLADLPQADADLRAEIDQDARRRGWPALHAELAQLDPETASRLAPNDSQRIQRALEVLQLTGKPLGEFFTRQGRESAPFRMLSIALLPSDRSVLHDRIAHRFDEMLATGLVAEVESLRIRYNLAPEMPSMRCVGYRQVWEMLEGRIPEAELRNRGVFATRQFAKRQLTWLKSTRELAVYDCLAPVSEAKIAKDVERHL